MSYITRGVCALAITALCTVGSFAQETPESNPAVDGEVILASCQNCELDSGYDTYGAYGEYDSYGEYGSCDCGGCGDCGAGACCDLCSCGSARGGCFFGGAEYLYVRANFSDSLAFVNYEVSLSSSPASTRTYVPLDYDYESSYRYFFGWRTCCGDEIRFSGTNLSSSASAGQLVDSSITNQGFQTPFSSFDGSTFGTPNDGAVVTIGSDVDLDYWDLTFSRNLAVGGPLNACCEPSCPAWDITWTGGVRVADGGWNRSGFVDSSNATTATTTDFVGQESLQFDGAGLLFGVQGRRYLGKRGIGSVYIRGVISALLGDLDYTRDEFTIVNGSPALPPDGSRDQASFTRIIPVTEVEVGGSVYLTSSLSFSGGYLFQAWHDLGMGSEVQVNDANDLRFDDANILGFDGFFARLEAEF